MTASADFRIRDSVDLLEPARCWRFLNERTLKFARVRRFICCPRVRGLARLLLVNLMQEAGKGLAGYVHAG